VRRMSWIVSALVLFLLVGCQPIPPSPTVVPNQVNQSTSPLPVPTADLPSTSPLSQPRPAPSTDEGKERFQIDRPVTVGDAAIKGSGLPGTGILLHDITRMGVELGATVIGEDGRFEIPVQALTPNVRIGIALAEPNDAIWADQALRGPEPLVVPLVGVYLDTVKVVP
jgi:hypothetical protein